jgi:tetratricopeptide (TPR) repeat protein
MPVVLAALCTAAYANTLHVPFIFDDIVSIVRNPAIRRLWPPSGLTVNHVGQLDGRLVVSFSLAVNYALGGYDVAGYHVFNLIVHFLNALLAFAVLRRALTSRRQADAPHKDMTWLAYAGAVLWLLHPLQTESVTYVSQRAESLMALFLLLTVYCSIRGMESPSRAFWFDSAMVACALGMCTKEVMVVTPFLVLAYDYVFVAPSLPAALRSRRKLYVGLAASWVILAALQFAATERWKTYQDAVPVRPWDYLKIQSGVIVHYLHLAAWPRGLVLDYSDWPRTLPLAKVLPEASLLLVLLALTISAIRARRWWGFWGAWFFLSLAPTSSFLPLPLEPATERRMYLPLLAVIAVSLGGAHHLICRLWTRLGWPDRARVWLQTGVTIVLALALGTATIQRNAQYHSAVSIWADVVAKRPASIRGHANLALALLEEGKAAESIPHFLDALRLDPNQPTVHCNLGDALVTSGAVDQGIAEFKEALRLDPNYAPARVALGNAMAKRSDVKEAFEHSQAALAAHPDDPAAHISFAQLLADMGRRDEAITHYEQALRLDPNNARAHYNLANLLADYDRNDEALSHYTAAARLDLNDPRIQINLGNLFLKQAHWDNAITAYTAALRLDPTAFEAHNNIAIAFADRGDLPEATAHFREAARLRPQLPEIHRELAEILDRQGLHDEAQRESAEARRLIQVAPPK